MAKGKDQPSDIGSVAKKAVIAVSFVLLVTVAMAIPFAYETQTLWYKSGADKFMLRAGQTAGLLALLFLMLQIVLAVRPNFLSSLYGVQKMVRWHRICGVLIAVSALIHVLLVLLPEGVGNLPFGRKYWPEMIGIVALLSVFLTVTVSSARNRLHLNYLSWRLWHRIIGYLLPLLACVHVLFVSETFQSGVPRFLLLTGISGIFFLVVIEKIRTKWQKKGGNHSIRTD